MTQLDQNDHEDVQANKGRTTGKSRGHYHRDRSLDEENVPPNLDYKALEQIADGVEKMILSWSKVEEREPYLPPCMQQQAVESPARGFCNTFNQASPQERCLGLKKRKEETEVRSIIRNESNELRFSRGNEAEAPPAIETKQKSSHHHRRSSRTSRKKERMLLKNDGQQLDATPNDMGHMKQENEGQSQVLQIRAKLKDGEAEVPPLRKANTGNFNSLFDSIVIEDELLEKKLEALTTMPPTPLLVRTFSHRQIELKFTASCRSMRERAK
ncbi:hypothetical protein R1flu_002667 [Riccia fluitans]|uniref:Uncharacterized protein n=1 Tax=Riccia fluitans TaxID=41844 RepID=A0ABD1Y9R1_9MARC